MNPKDREHISWESAAESHAGNTRTENQDAVLERPDLGLWAIADGMGGHADGAQASQEVVDTLGRLSRLDSLDEQLSAVVNSLSTVNEKLINNVKPGGLGLSGSTVATLLAHGDRGAIVWVGDSRVYRFRHGRLLQMTRDHSQIEDLIGRGLLKRSDARGHPSANVLTRAIGAAEALDPGVETFSISPGDTFLICSDGLYNEIDEYKIVEGLSYGSCARSAQILLQQTLETRARDNVSLVIVHAIDDRGGKTLVNPIVADDASR